MPEAVEGYSSGRGFLRERCKYGIGNILDILRSAAGLKAEGWFKVRRSNGEEIRLQNPLRGER